MSGFPPSLIEEQPATVTRVVIARVNEFIVLEVPVIVKLQPLDVGAGRVQGESLLRVLADHGHGNLRHTSLDSERSTLRGSVALVGSAPLVLHNK